MSRVRVSTPPHELVIDSPAGLLRLVTTSGALTRIDFLGAGVAPADDTTKPDKLLILAQKQLAEYFRGKRREFTVPLAPVGTAFQCAVWDELLAIPFGATTTYGDIARRIGRSTAVRAVGAANGANPIPIIIPCHRVIGSDGSLTGYGGGVEVKRHLLELEGIRPAELDAARQQQLFGD